VLHPAAAAALLRSSPTSHILHILHILIVVFARSVSPLSVALALVVRVEAVA
jgi:hypothetical protein